MVTQGAFKNRDVANASLEELQSILTDYLNRLQAVVTDPFESDPDSFRTFPMAAGEYILFNSRTMHRSRASQGASRCRIAISARYTLGSTLVYPQKRLDDSIDGSGLNISQHRCIRVHGTEFNEANSYAD